MQLSSLGNGVGFLKAGFLGFAGSGKTYTSKELAIGTRAYFGLDGPIAMLDTEGGAQYIASDVKRKTGKDLIGIQSRSLGDAVDFLKECEKIGASVVIIDSVTHLWREVCESYLKQINEVRFKKNQGPRTRLEFQDWGPIKEKWCLFSNLYLNSKLHIIIAGRAGFEWDYEEREDGTGKDLIKTGIKMKTEGEFGYEPSVLIQMEQAQTIERGKTVTSIVRRATVLKDRFGVIDGTQKDNPTFDFFLPHVKLLTPGAHIKVDTLKQTNLSIDENGDAEWQREKKQRSIYSEEIVGLLTSSFPGQGAFEKKAKADILFSVFGTRSWTAVENMESSKLKPSIQRVSEEILKYSQQKISEKIGGVE